VLADGWYSWLLPEPRSLAEVIEHWPLRVRKLIWRFGPFRALALRLAGRRYDVIATIRADAAWRSLLLLSALAPGSPKLVALQFIEHPPRPTGVGRLADVAWRPVERWAARRAVLRAQVLSPWEAELYSQRYRAEPGRFWFIPFAWRRAPGDAAQTFKAASERAGVIAAGRTLCDWETLFAAAHRETWPLTVVCSPSDRPLVESLNHDARATILTGLTDVQVYELLERSAVCVVAMREAGISQGHVRLCWAVDTGTPVIVSATRSLEGYVEDGRTAVLVPPGDAVALREGIKRLLADPQARDQLAGAAWERAGQWTWPDYLEAIAAFLRGEHPALSQAAAAPSAAASPVPASAASRREITFETPSPPIDTP
jgi:glycosyltransferase involved in cell wall biosynthesis